MPPSQHDGGRLLFIIIIIFWYASTPDSGPGLLAAPTIVKNRLERQRGAHAVLNSTAWGDFNPQPPPAPDADAGANATLPAVGYLNLTGFRESDGYAWDDLGRFKDRCEALSRHAVGDPADARPVWQNATGVVNGPWVFRNASISRYHTDYNLSTITPDVTWAGGASVDWGRNVTGNQGKMFIRLDDDDNAGTDPPELSAHESRRTQIRAREITATVNVEDADGKGGSWDMRVHGVHWPHQGAMLMTTTSEKFAGIFGLPHLTTRPDFFASSQALLNLTLDKLLSRKEQHTFVDQMDPWTSSLDSAAESWNPIPHCEYVMYMQLHPPTDDELGLGTALPGLDVVESAIAGIEDELRFPKGAPIDVTARFQMSVVAFSPDCAFFIESKGPPDYPPTDGEHLVGVKNELFLYSVTTWLLGLAAIIFVQVQLLKVQMRESSTPSTLGRISFITVSMMLLADGMTFVGASAWALSATTTMLPSMVVTCSSFLAMTVGVFLLGEIYKVQEPEWRRQERERERERERQRERERRNSPQPASAQTSDTQPPSTGPTQPAASAPIIVPSDQDVDAEIIESNTLPAPVTAGAAPDTNNPDPTLTLSSIFGRFVMMGLCLMFLTIAAMSWRPSLRSAYFNTLAFIYLSLWVPQIYRNIYRNCRRALTWSFLIGQSVCRLLPIAYFYLVDGNFAFIKPDWTAFAVIAGWVWFQIWILVAQSVLGPRFGVPKGWLPEAWEYHPVLREDNIEAGGLPIGLVSKPDGTAEGESAATAKKSDDGTTPASKGSTTCIHVIDCAICREDIEVPVIRAGIAAGASADGSGSFTAVLARRAYMVTPCRHIFHSPCLESWMRLRLQCPICREELPPL